MRVLPRKTAKEIKATQLVYGCTFKKRYGTADVAASSISTHRDIGKPMRAYSCKHCNGWHLTSRPPRPT